MRSRSAVSCAFGYTTVGRTRRLLRRAEFLQQIGKGAISNGDLHRTDGGVARLETASARTARSRRPPPSGCWVRPGVASASITVASEQNLPGGRRSEIERRNVSSSHSRRRARSRRGMNGRGARAVHAPRVRSVPRRETSVRRAAHAGAHCPPRIAARSSRYCEPAMAGNGKS
jgi:hypothetical protein